jgi:hypothetical protein
MAPGGASFDRLRTGRASWRRIARRFAAMPILFVALILGLLAEGVSIIGIHVSGEARRG